MIYVLIIYWYMIMLCSSKDVLMRVVAQNISPELTLVEKVFHHIYIFILFALPKFCFSCLYTNCVVITFSGDDCQPRLCHIRYNNSWCITYNAWWQIFAYSCYWQRCELISVCCKYRTATLSFTCLTYSNRWTNCCLPGCPATYPCNHSIGDP